MFDFLHSFFRRIPSVRPDEVPILAALAKGSVVYLTADGKPDGERLAAVMHRLPDGVFGRIPVRVAADALLNDLASIPARVQQDSPIALEHGGEIAGYLLSLEDAERALDRLAYLTALEAFESSDHQEL